MSAETVAIGGLSRTEAALRAWTKAVTRARQLEVEEQATFAEIHAAQEVCKREGLACDLELGAGMAASYSEWKQRRAVMQARELVP